MTKKWAAKKRSGLLLWYQLLILNYYKIYYNVYNYYNEQLFVLIVFMFCNLRSLWEFFGQSAAVVANRHPLKPTLLNLFADVIYAVVPWLPPHSKKVWGAQTNIDSEDVGKEC